MTRVTAATVAHACGVSQPTVSRILGKHAELYSPETRRRVLEASRRLGYRPNTAARATASGRFHAAGFLFRDDGSTVGSSMVYGVNSVLREDNLRLVLSPIHHTPADGETPDLLRELSIDGLIVSLMQDVPEAYRAAVESGSTPVVWVNAKLDRNCVHPDDAASTAEMTERLIGLGHRRVAWVGFDPSASGHYSGVDRRAGYREAMARAGLDPMVVEGGPVGVTGSRRAAIGRLFAADPLPTAVVCESDALAHPLIYAACQRGVSVPGRLSVTSVLNGGDDLLGPRLGGVAVPFREIGEAAARMLLARIDGGDPQPAVSLRGDFAPRDTVAPPHA